jgi:Uma2 family endonuclease
LAPARAAIKGYDSIMTMPVEKRRYSVKEYLDMELVAIDRHEYHFGEVVSSYGGSALHSFITANVIGELANALKGKPCKVADGNLRVRSTHTPRYVYPDASVICGPPQYDPEDAKHHTIMNPRVIVEVLSPTTEAYDRGSKFEYYRSILSVEECMLIDAVRPSVQTFLRQGDGTWSMKGVTGLNGTAKVRSLGIDILLSEIYDGITFSGPPGVVQE